MDENALLSAGIGPTGASTTPEAPSPIGGDTLRQFSSRLPSIVARFRARYTAFRTTGFIVMAIWCVYLLSTCIQVWPQERPMHLMSFVWVLGTQVAFLVTSVLLMTAAEVNDENAKSAQLIDSLYKAFASNAPFILLLRSFQSRLIAESIERVTAVEREQTRLVHGEVIPTGTKYTEYEHRHVRSDEVPQFLTSCAPGVHVVILSGDASSLSLQPLSIVSTDEQWRSVFQVFAQAACLVAVVPELSSSLVEETGAVVAQLRPKTVVLMPPSLHNERDGASWLSGMTRRERWQKVRKLSALGLPAYSESGAIIQFPNEDSVPVTRTYSRETIEELLKEHQANRVPIADVFAQLERDRLLIPMIEELERRAIKVM